jgi:hypothetical protein
MKGLLVDGAPAHIEVLRSFSGDEYSATDEGMIRASMRVASSTVCYAAAAAFMRNRDEIYVRCRRKNWLANTLGQDASTSGASDVG